MDVRSPETSFLGSHVNKIDAKGRVAVPADFRRALEAERDQGFYCLKGVREPRLECGGGDFITFYKREIRLLPAFTDPREQLEEAIFGSVRRLTFDTEGRVVIPDDYRVHANLQDRVLFQGRGDTFLILNAEEAERRIAATREAAREALMRLHAPKTGSGQ